ncbi:vitamin K epoxide reductase family protein [Dietzia cinnamea]|uniref:Vitamin K epoxide reductase family protein n=1 Tax=Dietzia cinnamea TaxID=321318 RepID=A0ABV3YDB8_9ACTN|nr:vitamin K epoxide reductase family protein [Dietzia cinnamea]MCT1886335.1 vitamin K epoxide reductase family protein [Dietzia cinnamea]MCT2058226.1 vitamin K epoxide reductase family protein [Dietzia cinnamea]MCT2121605.1 vitamin K epoxide reductase family protein [Dietzia cinnamea]MCT2140875.1 vitamin K epoxide reductase family protein [Dietzia cinnamea]MCT2145659.1 vitamin K epoxide reductase family protein [Dietzia cinnamea]
MRETTDAAAGNAGRDTPGPAAGDTAPGEPAAPVTIAPGPRDDGPDAGATIVGSRVFTDRWIGVLLAIGSAIALVASFQLSLDKIRLLENPDYTPACNFSILMSCKSVINSEQGAAFGFPNPFIGLVGYGIVIAIGVAAASGVRLPRWYWVGTLLGLTFAAGFVHWLAFQSIFSIQVLCPWCMVVWATTIPMFWYTLLHVLAKLTAARWVRTLQSWHLVPVVVWFLAVAGVILWAFWDFYWADFFANL